MFRKSFVFVVGILSLFLVLSSVLTSGSVLINAQEAAPAGPTPPWQAKLPPDAQPLADDLEVPEEVAQTVALRQSLTAEQEASIQAILAEYSPQLTAIAEALPVPDTGVVQDSKVFIPFIVAGNQTSVQASTAAAPADTNSAPELVVDEATLQALQASVADLQTLQAEINAKVSAVLTSDQQAQYGPVAEAQAKELGNIANLINQAAAPQADSDCFYCAYYGALAHYYTYYAYYYGYYDYYYYGTSYAYYDYLYNYYAYNYTVNGLRYAGGAYFDSYYGFGYDSNDWGSSAASYYNNSAYYAYYGGLYGYYNYAYYGSSYGYYGYLFGYVYGNSYAYNAYIYGYYCD